MAYKDFTNDIKNNTLNNIYLLYGSEKYLIDNSIKMLRDKIIPKDFLDFNYIQLDSSETTIDNIINSAYTVPLFSEKKIIHIKNTNYFNKSNLTQTDETKLLEYINSASSSTILIFNCNGVPDKRKKLYKSIQKNGKIVEFDKLTPLEFPKWVAKRFKLEKINIDSNTLKYLVNRIGYLNKNSDKTLYEIDSEINKLINFTKTKMTVDTNDINVIIKEPYETNIFEFLDGLSAGNIKNSINAVNKLIENGEAPLKIVSMINRQFRMIYKTKSLKESGYSASSISQKIGIPNFVANKNISFANYVSFENLSTILNLSTSYERMIKTGKMNDEIALETLVVEIYTIIKR